MPDGPAALEEAYNAVEDIVNEVEQYVKVGVILTLYTAPKFPFPDLYTNTTLFFTITLLQNILC